MEADDSWPKFPKRTIISDEEIRVLKHMPALRDALDKLIEHLERDSSIDDDEAKKVILMGLMTAAVTIQFPAVLLGRIALYRGVPYFLRRDLLSQRLLAVLATDQKATALHSSVAQIESEIKFLLKA